MKTKNIDKIIILDFGSQTVQLIARRIREKGVYAEIYPHMITLEEIKKINPKGIIFSGGPKGLYEKGSVRSPKGIFDLGVPILGICYGLQLIAEHFGGRVVQGNLRKEYGEARLKIKNNRKFFDGINRKELTVWMSHGDEVEKMPKGFEVIAYTKDSPYAVIQDNKRRIYAIQYHAEVSHTQEGTRMLENFVTKICNCQKDWKSGNIIENMIKEVRETVGAKKVLHAISGGVDSTVMAVILHKAIGDNLRCVMVDTGFLRKGEVDKVSERFKKYLKTKVEVIDAKKRFISALKGVEDGQQRRKIIGREYMNVFNKLLGKEDFLSQGTLYPDVIESAVDTGDQAQTIKTHHNRAKEVIDLMNQGRVIEIFKYLFKDEVRSIGKKLGLPREIIKRQPFPGPGLAIRILGEITGQKLDILKEADAIVLEELKKSGLYYKISQTVVALDSHQVTCVKGDGAEKGHLIFIRNVKTSDFMTLSVYDIPSKLRKKIATRILNEVRGTGRVLFDESTKPPATVCYL